MLGNTGANFRTLLASNAVLPPVRSIHIMQTPTPSSSSQPERSLNRQVVLDEDEYTEALSHIIARDFFPSLVHLDATNDYLEALSSKDPQLIQASVRRLETLSTPVSRRERPWQTPSQTPYASGPSDTPLRTPRERGEPPEKRPRYDTSLSLDGFQARYTSEDNSSFTQILDDENRKRREKWAWAWDAQKRMEDQRKMMIEGRERLLLEPPPQAGVKEKFRIEPATPAALITDGSAVSGDSVQGAAEDGDGEMDVAGKEITFKPQGELVEKDMEEVDVMAPRKDTRAAGVDGWNFKVRFLFP